MHWHSVYVNVRVIQRQRLWHEKFLLSFKVFITQCSSYNVAIIALLLFLKVYLTQETKGRFRRQYCYGFVGWVTSSFSDHFLAFDPVANKPQITPWYNMLLRPKSHLLYGEDTAAVHPLNWQKRAAAAEKLRWSQGGPTPFGYILQAVGSPWNYSAEL